MSTYNRCELLQGAVESVLSQAEGAPAFELIVVDNNSTDRTRDVVHALAATSGGRLRYVFEGRQGLSHGRNAGIAQARAPIVAFTDDDVRVAPNWLATLKRALDEHPDVDFVGGKVLPRWPSDPPSWLTRDHWAPLALTDLGDEPIVVDRNVCQCLVGASLAIRRTAFDRLGLFDPAFQHIEGSVSAAEDHDFELRVWRSGGRGMYVPDLVVTADVQPNRLTKAYHRKWHSDHGWLASGLLRPGEMYDRDGALVTAPPDALSFLGFPLWRYAGAARTAADWLRAWLRRDEPTALGCEFSLREELASLRWHHARFRAAGHRFRVTDVVRILRHVSRRRRDRPARAGG